MKNGRARSISWMTAAVLLVLAPARGSSALGSGPARPAPLAAEIERRSAGLKQGDQPVLARAAQDLAKGRRLLALHRLAMAEVSLATGTYLSTRPADQHKDMARFEAEWTRMGKVLHADLGPPSPAVLAGVQPAALRGLGEAAIPQVSAYYAASLEYGRSTTPGDGLFYLATAQAQRDFVELSRRLSMPTSLKPPPLRSLRAEIDGLQ